MWHQPCQDNPHSRRPAILRLSVCAEVLCSPLLLTQGTKRPIKCPLRLRVFHAETVKPCHAVTVCTYKLCASVMRSVIHCLATMSATLLYWVRRLQALIIIVGLGGANE